MRVIPLAQFCTSNAAPQLNGIFVFSRIMTYTKYKVNFDWLSITPVQVQSETEKFVTLENGLRVAKSDFYGAYCDTHEDAVRTIYDHLLKKAEAAKNTFLHHEERLNEFAKKHNLL